MSGCTFLRGGFSLFASHLVGAGLCSAPTRSRKTVKFIKISAAPSIDGNRSTATSCKFGTPVSGGAYQDAREVTSEWNDIQKLGACLKSDAGSTKRNPAPLFSPIFSGKTEKIGPSETTGSRKSAKTSQALRASIHTPFVPSGHFPLIGGIGP